MGTLLTAEEPSRKLPITALDHPTSCDLAKSAGLAAREQQLGVRQADT